MRILFALLLSLIFVSCNYVAKKNSNEVLDAFKAINIKLEDANRGMIHDKDSLILKAQDKYPDYKTQLNNLAMASIKLTTSIDFLKLNGLALEGDYGKMDSSKYFDDLLFKGNVPSEIGQHLILAVQNYTNVFQANFKGDFPKLSEKVKEDFSTESIKGENWLAYNFQGFPLIASITKFTQMENDVLAMNRELVRLISEKE